MHELKKCLYPLLSFLFLLNVSNAQESKYWIFFTDKGETGDIKPEDVLSPRAIERRANQGLSLDFYDFPVNQSYIGILENAGITTRLKSRWLNAASAFLTPHDAAWVRTLSFVKSVEKIASYELILDEPSALGAIMSCPEIEDAELPSRQLSMVGLDRLHEMGYSGNDVLVAVFDNGYLNVNELDGFKHLRDNDRIVATRDYVDGDESLYHSCEHCRHGTYVFSILAARDTALGLIGSAPDADFILLRTENDASETTQEEDNWVAAAEFADSMGAQVFTTSLGYFTFDGGIGNYGPNDRDGNTSIITRAADLAASRGIVVVNSAGNSGAGGLVMPADGDSVLAIGAVNPCAEYATFSSQGPSADGRVKPDISALGQGNFLIFPDGELRRGSGTSFSCPIASGLAACLIQAFPNATNTQIYDALKQSASQYDNPDEFLGYGIPNASLAMNILQSSIGEENQLFLFPNPTQDRFAIIL
ncbi:MAG: S8 family serine peptidase, partial [Bacteroidia bacterium]|nr:S8 family serine peptidase [Bacteroidia bacterium]